MLSKVCGVDLQRSSAISKQKSPAWIKARRIKKRKINLDLNQENKILSFSKLA